MRSPYAGEASSRSTTFSYARVSVSARYASTSSTVGGNPVKSSDARRINFSFAASGGLPSVNLTLGGYSGELLGFNASQNVAASNDYDQANLLLQGFMDRSNAISGVNIDEELANTILYQNA